MKKYYFKIGLCAFLIFSNACQKADNQVNSSAEKSEHSQVETQPNVEKPNSPQGNPSKEAKPFISQNGSLFMPLERQGNVQYEKTEKLANGKASEVFATIEPSKIQTFSVKNEEPQAIELPQGTKIYIPENAFVLEETGELVTGEVKVEAKEVRNVAECLKMGVTTMSNAGLLESGGMLYVGATYEGQKCALQKGKELDVEMPSWGEQKEGMKLFSGEKNADGKIEWKENPDNQISTTAPKETPWQRYYQNCSNYQRSIDSIEDYIIGKQRTLDDLEFGFREVTFKILPNNGIIKEDKNLAPPKKYFQFTGKTINRLAKKGDDYEVVKDTCHLYVNISKIRGDGTVASWKVFKSTNPTYSNEITYRNIFFSRLGAMLKNRKCSKTGTVELAVYLPKKLLPKFRKVFPNYKDVTAYKQKYQAEYAEYAASIRGQNANNLAATSSETCQKYRNLMLAEMAKTEKRDRERAEKSVSGAGTYAFRTSRLGWINCDRFVSQPKTTLAMELGDYKEANVTIIYKKIRSIMNHSLSPENVQKAQKSQLHALHILAYQTLNDIPTNQDITLFVVKKVNDKMYYALKETNTNKHNQNDFDFQELTEEKLFEISKYFEAV